MRPEFTNLPKTLEPWDCFPAVGQTLDQELN
jgi:hypothetical protein